jgi:uncharacterized protein (TIGR02145 family)
MKILLLFTIIYLNIPAQTPGAGVTDIDGNQYSTVIIGNQEWMAENLRTSKYSNGDTIPNVTDNTQLNCQWVNLTYGAWCHYNNDIQYEIPYGKLYNWYTVDDPRNVCPSGWHVPQWSEWTILFDHLGGEAVAGGKLKSVGTQYWQSPNTGATNESGFNGIPAGIVKGSMPFLGLGQFAFYWSSSPNPILIELWYNNNSIEMEINSKEEGYSLRCVKGYQLGLIKPTTEKKELVKVVDLIGRETQSKPNEVLIYIYSDGSTERVLNIE